MIVPVVLDVYGEAGSHYTTEVTLVNDGTIATPVDLVYRPAPGFGEITGVPVVTVDLAARQQVTIPDVLAYLRSHGMQIPDGTTAAQAGTLTATFRYLTGIDAPSTVVLARTTTPNTDAATGGAFGLFYPAVAKGGGARTSALVPGLAQDDAVRSNLAVVNTGGGSELPITLEARLYDADTGAAAGSPLTVRLAVGDWVQWSRVHDARRGARLGEAVHRGRPADRGRRHLPGLRRPERRRDVGRQLPDDDLVGSVLRAVGKRMPVRSRLISWEEACASREVDA